MASSVLDVTNTELYSGIRTRSLLLGLAGILLLIDLLRRLLTGDLALALFFNYVWNGLVFGLAVGLGGIGLSLTYDILEFANFAHGDYITTTAFVGWGSTYLVAGLGKFSIGSLFFLGVGGTVYPGDLGVSVVGTPLAIALGLGVAAIGGALLAVVLDRAVYSSMRETGSITLLIASIGVAFILRYLIVYVFSQEAFGLTVSAWSYNIQLPGGSLTINAPSLLLIGVAAVTVTAIHLVLTRTKLGKAMRATADNPDLARITGIPSERIITFTWIIGGALAGLAGFMVVLLQGTITFQTGWTLLLLIFAAVIMGGIGSVYGAVIGGVLIGLITRVSLVWIPSSFTEATAFVALVVVLLVKPEGILGGETV